MPRMTAVMMPLRAVGRTTCITVRHCWAPSASADSRNPGSTSLSISSLVRATVGSIRNRKREGGGEPGVAATDNEDRVHEQAGDDGREAAHRVDDHPDGRCETAADLVQVDSSENTEGHGHDGRDADLQERADDRVFGATGSRGGIGRQPFERLGEEAGSGAADALRGNEAEDQDQWSDREQTGRRDRDRDDAVRADDAAVRPAATMYTPTRNTTKATTEKPNEPDSGVAATPHS